jgi:OFA family oxalate/formate antiporter-like MFS transporter
MVASYGGHMVEKHGPRFTGMTSGILFGIGHLLGGLAITYDQEWLMYAGYGLVGGCGLGFGYVTPVSPMVKWFPDKRGMASGFAVMGFGLGAFIAMNQNDWLLGIYGIADTFNIMAVIYFCFVFFPAQLLCKPPTGWAPEGFDAIAAKTKIREGLNLTTWKAVKTIHFQLCWIIVFSTCILGVSALSQAKPMQKEIFHKEDSYASFMASLWAWFNCFGRLFWPIISDQFSKKGVSRKFIYLTFNIVQLVVCLLIPLTTDGQIYWLFFVFICTLISMYGGVFGAITAFLADLFGPANVGAVHGVILSAWGAAGGVGAIIITGIKEGRKDDGYSGKELYDPFFNVGILCVTIGMICSLLIRPLVSRSGKVRMHLGWGETIKRKWANRSKKKAAKDTKKGVEMTA